MSNSACEVGSKNPGSILRRLEYLFPTKVDLALDRILALLRDLKDPHRALPPVIHVAGTNGKGSTIAFLRSILEAAGLRVHVYTSPHLVSFNERIRIAGNLICDDHLAELLGEVEEINGGRPITFFEATTAAAFLAFSRHPADFAIIETGMGGRQDATNVIPDAVATAITPISLDHTAFLGSTIELIAREKAGIFRPGAPAVIGQQCAEVMDVLTSEAHRVGARVFEHGANWEVEALDDRFLFSGTRQLILPRPPLAGDHQFANAGLALSILDQIPGLRLRSADYMRGILNTKWPARLMPLPKNVLGGVVPGHIELIVDGGHNAGAAEALAAWADGLDEKLDLVVGMLNMRDPREFLVPLAGHVRRLRGVAIDGTDQTHDPAAIVDAARASGISDSRASRSVASALAELSYLPGARRILICGSLHLAGNVLADFLPPSAQAAE